MSKMVDCSICPESFDEESGSHVSPELLSLFSKHIHFGLMQMILTQSKYNLPLCPSCSSLEEEFGSLDSKLEFLKEKTSKIALNFTFKMHLRLGKTAEANFVTGKNTSSKLNIANNYQFQNFPRNNSFCMAEASSTLNEEEPKNLDAGNFNTLLFPTTSLVTENNDGEKDTENNMLDATNEELFQESFDSSEANNFIMSTERENQLELPNLPLQKQEFLENEVERANIYEDTKKSYLVDESDGTVYMVRLDADINTDGIDENLTSECKDIHSEESMSSSPVNLAVDEGIKLQAYESETNGSENTYDFDSDDEFPNSQVSQNHILYEDNAEKFSPDIIKNIDEPIFEAKSDTLSDDVNNFESGKHLKRKYKKRSKRKFYRKSNISPYLLRCDQCDFTTNYKSGLKTHKTRKHARLLNFSCRECKKSFKSSDAVKAHFKRVHRKLTFCIDCVVESIPLITLD